MTLAGTAPQSTSSATSPRNSSSWIICRVPPMEAEMASLGRNATVSLMARIKCQIASRLKSTMQENIEAQA